MHKPTGISGRLSFDGLNESMVGLKQGRLFGRLAQVG
jgi:hypothetical protein